MNSIAFINAIKKQAIEDMKKHGILASLTIAQAIIESGWGESGLTKKANNLFGMKAGTSWRGETITLPTKEWDGKKYIDVNAKWRKYDYWRDSISDHTSLLLTPRYSPLVGVTDYRSACHIIKDCGYATSPVYPETLINIIEQYQLQKYDSEAIIERGLDNMDIKELQQFLNNMGVTDKNGNPLKVDGSNGPLTQSATKKAKEVILFIIK